MLDYIVPSAKHVSVMQIQVNSTIVFFYCLACVLVDKKLASQLTTEFIPINIHFLRLCDFNCFFGGLF